MPEVMGTGPMQFKVNVPPPYPGVQYRKSMNMEDRWPRYAQNDSVVKGVVEGGGQWLRLEPDVFIPMKVGSIAILTHVPPGSASGAGAGSTLPVAASGAAAAQQQLGAMIARGEWDWSTCQESPQQKEQQPLGAMIARGEWDWRPCQESPQQQQQ